MGSYIRAHFQVQLPVNCSFDLRRPSLLQLYWRCRCNHGLALSIISHDWKYSFHSAYPEPQIQHMLQLDSWKKIRMSEKREHLQRLRQYTQRMLMSKHHMTHDLCSQLDWFWEFYQTTYWVVPPILICGHVPVKASKFFKHWVVAVTFVKYEGNVKNSKLEYVRK